jgi:hypothetical protein
MNDDKTAQALAQVARAEERLPKTESVQLRFRNASAACGFTGLRLLWFDTPSDAIGFLANDFPHLYPEVVEPEDITEGFASIGQAYARQEIDHHTALERMSEVLAKADHESDEETIELGAFSSFDDLVSGNDDSNEGVAARYYFRTGEPPAIMQGDDPVAECEEGIPPITAHEREGFAQFLVGPYRSLF